MKQKARTKRKRPTVIRGTFEWVDRNMLARWVNGKRVYRRVG
jgi:hypothetical protein